MKYIVVNLEGHEAIFVFPKAVNHNRMAEALGAIRFGDGYYWERKLHRAREKDGVLISAGFISGGVCLGRSETLGLASRGEADTKLLREAGL
jgi:hypothetical protein